MELRSKRSITDDITVVKLLMRRYLFHALESGILFRGAFSIGSYIEDARTNTVMGEAVSDAASWYDKAAWMGLSSTPRTNTVLEFHYADRLDDSRFIHKYDVPLKSGKTFGLYAISWPGLFLDTGMLELEKKTDGRRWFLEILHKLSVPEGTETIFENTKRYFSFIESALLEKL